MGAHAPRIVSPLTGEPEAAPGTGWRFEPTEEAMARWRHWWRFANVEQLSTFVAITFVTILFTSFLAYSTLSGRDDLPRDISFLLIEGNVLAERVGALVRPPVLGGRRAFPCSAPRSASSTSPAVSPPTCCAPPMPSAAARASFTPSWPGRWSLVGSLVIATGLTQPLVLLIIAACVAAFSMFIYSALLIVLNRRLLPPPLRPRLYRTLPWSGRPACSASSPPSPPRPGAKVDGRDRTTGGRQNSQFRSSRALRRRLRRRSG